MSETEKMENNQSQSLPADDESLLAAASVDGNPNLDVILNRKLIEVPVFWIQEFGTCYFAKSLTVMPHGFD